MTIGQVSWSFWTLLEFEIYSWSFLEVSWPWIKIMRKFKWVLKVKKLKVLLFINHSINVYFAKSPNNWMSSQYEQKHCKCQDIDLPIIGSALLWFIWPLHATLSSSAQSRNVPRKFVFSNSTFSHTYSIILRQNVMGSEISDSKKYTRKSRRFWGHQYFGPKRFWVSNFGSKNILKGKKIGSK